MTLPPASHITDRADLPLIQPGPGLYMGYSTQIFDPASHIPEYDSTIPYQTFSLECNGARGDMIYITDDGGIHEGHGISEVNVIEATGDSIGEFMTEISPTLL